MNTTFERLLSEVKNLLRQAGYDDIDPTPTLFSLYWRERFEKALEWMRARDPALRKNLATAFVGGSVGCGYAVPLHRYVAGAETPPQTARLLVSAYAMIFTQQSPKPALHESRFLDKSLSSDVDLRLFFYERSAVDKTRLLDELKEALAAQDEALVTHIDCHLWNISELRSEDALCGYCLFLDEKRRAHDPFPAITAHDVATALTRLLFNLLKRKHLADVRLKFWRDAMDGIMRLYTSGRDQSEGMLTADWEPVADRPWHEANALFFNALRDRKCQTLLAEDVTISETPCGVSIVPERTTHSFPILKQFIIPFASTDNYDWRTGLVAVPPNSTGCGSVDEAV